MATHPNQILTPCCALYETICSHLPNCVVVQDFWEGELAHPSIDQESTLGDLIILDKTLPTTHKDFFGIIVSRTASIITAFTPGYSIVKKPSIVTQKVRINEGSKQWREYLLLQALRRGVLTYSEREEVDRTTEVETTTYGSPDFDPSCYTGEDIYPPSE